MQMTIEVNKSQLCQKKHNSVFLFVYSHKTIFLSYTSYRENTVLKLSSDDMHLATSHKRRTSLESINGLYDGPLFQDICKGNVENTNEEPRYLSFQEILDLIATPPNTIMSEESQTEQQLDDQRQIWVRKYTNWSRVRWGNSDQKKKNLRRFTITWSFFVRKS